jgi:inner membrane protein
MDNITHTLTGLMMSKAGLNRWCPRATPVLLMAANAPDVDVVSGFGGALNYLDHHRGLTHSVTMIPVIALLPLLVMLVFARKGMAWKRAYAISLAGVASHVALDWTNIYGVRLLTPFSGHWFRLDITSVVDLWIWAVLLLASAWLLLSRMVSSEIGARASSGRAVALLALAFFPVYEFGRFVLHERAMAELDSRVYEGVAPRRIAALPSFVNPLHWTGLVETDTFYMLHSIDLRNEFDPAAGRIYYKPLDSPELEAARQTSTFERFLRFSQFPFFQVTPTDEPEEGFRVEALDLRFGLPGEGRFMVTAILNRKMHVLRSWYQFDPPGGGSRFR